MPRPLPKIKPINSPGRRPSPKRKASPIGRIVYLKCRVVQANDERWILHVVDPACREARSGLPDTLRHGIPVGSPIVVSPRLTLDPPIFREDIDERPRR